MVLRFIDSFSSLFYGIIFGDLFEVPVDLALLLYLHMLLQQLRSSDSGFGQSGAWSEPVLWFNGLVIGQGEASPVPWPASV